MAQTLVTGHASCAMLGDVRRWVAVVASLGVVVAAAAACSTQNESPASSSGQAGEGGAGAVTQPGRGASANNGGISTRGGSHQLGVAGDEAGTVAGADAGAGAAQGGQASGLPECFEAAGAPPATCEAFCSHVNEATACTSPEGVAPCVEWCEGEMAAFMPEACQPQWQTLLACGACAEISCEQVDCGSFACDDPPHQYACEGLAEAVNDCAYPCLSEGEYDGGSGNSSYHYLKSHCECPSSLGPGAASGDPCTTDLDCAEECCTCSHNSGKFVARACEAGFCVGGAKLCAHAEQTLAPFCASDAP